MQRTGERSRSSHDRIAVITGGGTGVGAAVALALAEDATHVCLIGRRLQVLATVAARARCLGGEATCYPADLASESDQLELAARLTGELPHVDVLVQNAAICVPGSIDGACLEDFDVHYRTNLRAPYVLTRALLPMLRARHGQVVFINSSSGINAKPMSSQYDATKHALRALADSLRAEVNGDGVRVLSVYLGQTATDLQARLRRLAGSPYRPELLLQPRDVAAVIRNALNLPRTAEVTEVHIRPMIDPRSSASDAVQSQDDVARRGECFATNTER